MATGGVRAVTELRRIRSERDLSQEELARLSKISRPTIHRAEHGQQKPHESTIGKIARALEVRPEEIAPELFAGPRNRPGVRPTRENLDAALPYIRKAAHQRALNPDDAEELEGAGREGFYEACLKYDPSCDVPFDRYARWLSVCRVKDEVRRLYKQHPGYGLENQGIEPWTY